MSLRIISWNVNGLRAAAGKGFADWLAQKPADIVAVQETRALLHQLPDSVRTPLGWHVHVQPAERLGYSGVGLYAQSLWDDLQTSTGRTDFDVEGRLQVARFGKLWVVNGYFPNGNGKERDNSRIPYKLDFYRHVFALMEPQFRAGEPILVMGDFNTAHQEIDLARPKDNRETSGFRAEEREELDRWLRAGWVDTFRHLHQQETGAYSWWSQRFGVREKNIGWRIDYILASPGAMAYVQDAFIWPHITGSDHCPVGVVLDRAVLAHEPPSP
jgi:exodeoxyribonuclease-3